jgi:hypothetical protein
MLRADRADARRIEGAADARPRSSFSVGPMTIHSSKVSSRFGAIVAAVALWFAAYAPALHAQQNDTASLVQQRVAEAKTRLKLTADQEAKIKPLIQQSEQELKALREKYGTQVSRADKRHMLQEARGIQQKFQSQVEPILNSEQKAEWAKMKSEAKDKIRARMQDRGGGGS